MDNRNQILSLEEEVVFLLDLDLDLILEVNRVIVCSYYEINLINYEF